MVEVPEMVEVPAVRVAPPSLSARSHLGTGDRLNLRVGESIQVKSEAEILATLDQDGKLDALPFMPEMLQYCGQQFRVFKRADKTCDTIEYTGLRRMRDTVHLAELRCSGGAHDGCQAACLLFWKEAWLRRVGDGQARHVGGSSGGRVAPPLAGTTHPLCTRKTLTAKTQSVNDSGEVFYMCQATEVRNATCPLPKWHAGQYARDVRSGNATLSKVIAGTLIALFNKTQALLRRFMPRRLLIAGGLEYPFLAGALTKTPKELLNLEPGDLVEVKSKEEIVATLDKNNRNRGLLFDREMVGYCGRRTRVLRRVNRIIDEKTRKMKEVTNDCLMLDGTYCRGDFNQFCPRGIHAFWREIWLKKVEVTTQNT
jgi:hypothetical protein